MYTFIMYLRVFYFIFLFFVFNNMLFKRFNIYLLNNPRYVHTRLIYNIYINIKLYTPISPFLFDHVDL